MILDECEDLRSTDHDQFSLIIHPWTLMDMEHELQHLPDYVSIETSPWYPEMTYGVINETEWGDRIEAETREHRPVANWKPPRN